jgi:hypothetical protein
MNFSLSTEQLEIRRSVEAICAHYDLAYWPKCDSEETFPEAFFQDMVAGAIQPSPCPQRRAARDSTSRPRRS